MRAVSKRHQQGAALTLELELHEVMSFTKEPMVFCCMLICKQSRL